MNYQAENSALQTLFNRMNSKKTEQAQRLDYAHEAGLEIPKPNTSEQLPPPSQPSPIHSAYLDQKRQEDEARKIADEQQRENIRRQLEQEKAQLNHMNQQLSSSDSDSSESKQQPLPASAAPAKKTNGQKKNAFLVGQKQGEPSQKMQGGEVTTAPSKPKTAVFQNKFDSQVASQKTPEMKKDTPPLTKIRLENQTGQDIKPVQNEIKAEDQRGSATPAGPQSAPETPPAKRKEKKPSAAHPESQGTAPTAPTTSHVNDSDIRATLGAIFGKKPASNKPASQQARTPVSSEKSQSQYSVHTNAETETSGSIAVRSHGMQMTPTGTREEKLSITEIIPMKTDNGSIYDSAVKPSNAFRANVFLDCSYNEKTHEGCYGLVVDMGSKKMIQGTSGQTSDEWEYGFLGIIHAIRICRENNVKEVMFIIRDPLCEIIQQNTDGLIWGYSLTRREFYNEFQRSKGEFASGFYNGELSNDSLQLYRDLAETISRTLIFPPQEEL